MQKKILKSLSSFHHHKCLPGLNKVGDHVIDGRSQTRPEASEARSTGAKQCIAMALQTLFTGASPVFTGAPPNWSSFRLDWSSSKLNWSSYRLY